MELNDFKNSDLFVEELLLMKLINEGEDVGAYKFFSNKETILNSLEANLFVKKTENGYELRSKGRELFGNKSDINFDEFWEAFPAHTPDGRILRASSKKWHGKETRDYTTCKQKYLSKVKNKEIHNEIVRIITARVNSGDYKYINNIETYINQQCWQKDVKYLKSEQDWSNQRV